MPRTRLVMIFAALACLILGLQLPVMRFERLFFLSETPSILAIVAGLWSEGDRALAALVASFSILFPVTKLTILAWTEIGKGPNAAWLDRALPYLSKWSMLDVTVVAIAIFAAKTSGLASAVSQPGLWFYAASALISGVVVPLVSTGLKNRQDQKTIEKSPGHGPKDLQ